MMNSFKSIKKMYNYFNLSRKHGYSNFHSFILLIMKVLIYILNKSGIKHTIEYNNISLASLENNHINISTKRLNNLLAYNKYFAWFIPNWSNIYGGGHYTLFRFIYNFSKFHNVKNIIYIYNNQESVANCINKEKELNSAFNCDYFQIYNNLQDLNIYDATFATTWQSAYFVKNIIAKQKFYFMQDYESLFYPAGTLSLQANYTYTFGFVGITGGGWLKSMYESYGSPAKAYMFSADKDIFYPLNYLKPVKSKVKHIFFYGRHTTERRAYELGIESLRLIQQKFPNIEILIAGCAKGIIIPNLKYTALGNLTLKETGEIYRNCDIGIAFSATNMSYLPVELMASGCPVISNKGPQVEWFCKDNFNALLVDPMPIYVLQAVENLVASYDLRNKLALNGLNTTDKTTWEEEINNIYNYIITNIK